MVPILKAHVFIYHHASLLPVDLFSLSHPLIFPPLCLFVCGSPELGGEFRTVKLGWLTLAMRKLGLTFFPSLSFYSHSLETNKTLAGKYQTSVRESLRALL